MSLTAQLQLRNESADGLGPALQQIWRAGQLLDVTLVTEDGTAVEGHKLVLSAYSSVFRGMLSRYQYPQVSSIVRFLANISRSINL